MNDDDDSGEKPHEPTERRLDDARRQGDIALSPELTTFAVQAVMALVIIFVGATTLQAAGAALAGFLSRADGPALAGAAPGFAAAVRPGLGAVLLVMLPWFLLPPAAAVLALIAQKAPAFAPSKLAPKGSRLSPVANAKQKYGPRGLVEFLKSLARLVVVAGLLGVYLADNLDRIAATAGLEPRIALGVLGDLVAGLLVRVVIAAAAFAVIDLVWQHHSHHSRNRMTRRQLLDEMKESEGDPAMRQQRRARATALATAPLRKVVAGASVVIVNPTHYAVALAWDPARDAAPRCVAKGVDAIAQRIRELAAEHGVPVHSDPPTARALFAEARIGARIDRRHYRAVAAAIRFADDMRLRAARR
ncbi:MAG: flagellar biosynthesis protein FlhB [Rubellimicrobium sp.]|nr:flagellar biosynthesis protein FlhB [Rubellimicrobium sp.]